MTADSLVVGVVSSLAGFIAWFAIPLLGFAILQNIGSRR